MYEKILLPVDDATTDTAVLYHAAEVANLLDADVTLLFVADTNQESLTVVESEVVDVLEAAGGDVLEEAEAVLESLGLSPRTDVVEGTPAATIVDYAESYDYDLVVMPTHGRAGLTRTILGSVTEKVVRLSQVPVLTARMREADDLVFPYERILVPVDGSPAAERAAAHALDLASELDATVHVLAAVDDRSLGVDVRSTALAGPLAGLARDTVDDVAEYAAEHAPDVDVETHVEHGAPATVIREAIDAHDAHAVVMGTTGRRGLDRVLLGSVTERTVRSSSVPVITLRRPEE